MKQIRLAFCFVPEDGLLCFLLIGQLKVCFHFPSPGPITESNFKSQAVCPALSAARNSLSTLAKSDQRERERVILAPVLLRDPLIVAFCRWPFDPCWPPDIMLPAGKTGLKGSGADGRTNTYQFNDFCSSFWLIFPTFLCRTLLFFNPKRFRGFLEGSRNFTKA